VARKIINMIMPTKAKPHVTTMEARIGAVRLDFREDGRSCYQEIGLYVDRVSWLALQDGCNVRHWSAKKRKQKDRKTEKIHGRCNQYLALFTNRQERLDQVRPRFCVLVCVLPIRRDHVMSLHRKFCKQLLLVQASRYDWHLMRVEDSWEMSWIPPSLTKFLSL
jgi:hypothetical protein